MKATHAATGETVTAHARATGEGGHYTASMTLPTAGAWNWEIQPDAGFPAELTARFTPLEVSAPSAAAAQAASFYLITRCFQSPPRRLATWRSTFPIG